MPASLTHSHQGHKARNMFLKKTLRIEELPSLLHVHVLLSRGIFISKEVMKTMI